MFPPRFPPSRAPQIRGTAGGVGRRPRGGRTVTSDAAPPKTPSGTTETTGSSDGYRDVAGAQQEQHVLPAAATPSPHYGRSIARKVLLQPVQQWQAHESTITSVEGASFRGKLDLLVTAGADCFVHLWTIAGAHIGTFGQVKMSRTILWLAPQRQLHAKYVGGSTIKCVIVANCLSKHRLRSQPIALACVQSWASHTARTSGFILTLSRKCNAGKTI